MLQAHDNGKHYRNPCRIRDRDYPGLLDLREESTILDAQLDPLILHLLESRRLTVGDTRERPQKLLEFAHCKVRDKSVMDKKTSNVDVHFRSWDSMTSWRLRAACK